MSKYTYYTSPSLKSRAQNRESSQTNEGKCEKSSPSSDLDESPDTVPLHRRSNERSTMCYKQRWALPLYLPLLSYSAIPLVAYYEQNSDIAD